MAEAGRTSCPSPTFAVDAAVADFTVCDKTIEWVSPGAGICPPAPAELAASADGTGRRSGPSCWKNERHGPVGSELYVAWRSCPARGDDGCSCTGGMRSFSTASPLLTAMLMGGGIKSRKVAKGEMTCLPAPPLNLECCCEGENRCFCPYSRRRLDDRALEDVPGREAAVDGRLARGDNRGETPSPGALLLRALRGVSSLNAAKGATML